MKYLTIAKDDLTTRQSAMIAKKRFDANGIESEIGVFIPLDDIEKVLGGHLSKPEIKRIAGDAVAMIEDLQCQS